MLARTLIPTHIIDHQVTSSEVKPWLSGPRLSRKKREKPQLSIRFEPALSSSEHQLAALTIAPHGTTDASIISYPSPNLSG